MKPEKTNSKERTEPSGKEKFGKSLGEVEKKLEKKQKGKTKTKHHHHHQNWDPSRVENKLSGTSPPKTYISLFFYC